MSKKDCLIYGSIASAIASMMLVYAMRDLDIGFYDLLRIVIFSVGLITAYTAFKFSSHIIVVFSALAAMLFNPLAPVRLESNAWQIVDAVAALYFLVLTIVFISEIASPSTKND